SGGHLSGFCRTRRSPIASPPAGRRTLRQAQDANAETCLLPRLMFRTCACREMVKSYERSIIALRSACRPCRARLLKNRSPASAPRISRAAPSNPRPAPNVPLGRRRLFQKLALPLCDLVGGGRRTVALARPG